MWRLEVEVLAQDFRVKAEGRMLGLKDACCLLSGSVEGLVGLRVLLVIAGLV